MIPPPFCKQAITSLCIFSLKSKHVQQHGSMKLQRSCLSIYHAHLWNLLQLVLPHTWCVNCARFKKKKKKGTVTGSRYSRAVLPSQKLSGILAYNLATA